MMTGPVIYFDHHATTPVDPRVLEAMLPYFTTHFGNASSVNHRFGWDAAEAVEQARQQIATVLEVSERSVIFTSGATEANNLAIKGVLQAAGPGSHFLTNAAEHRSVLDPARSLAREGFPVTILPVDEFGLVSPSAIAEAITPQTRLVSVMLGNNEVGSFNLIPEIAQVCHQAGVLLHVDAVQAFGKHPFTISEIGADLLSLSAHKLYGPKGVGALFIRPGTPRIRLQPQMEGGGHERHFRSGTLPVPLIVGLGKACELAMREMPEEQIRIRQLRDQIWQGLQQNLSGLHLNGHPSKRLPGNLNFSVEGVDGEALMMSLKRIAISSGSACSSTDPQPSHVLLAMGRSSQLTRASLRFGVGRFNTTEEAEIAIEEVTTAIRRLRGE